MGGSSVLLIPISQWSRLPIMLEHFMGGDESCVCKISNVCGKDLKEVLKLDNKITGASFRIDGIRNADTWLLTLYLRL